MKSELNAAIFDVDGLILDSEAFYAEAWEDAFNSNSFKKYRVDDNILKQWFYDNLSGKKIGNQLDFIQEKFPNNDIPKIYMEYRKLFTQRLKTSPIKVRDGFFELLNYLKGKGVKLGIASTSSLETIKNAFKKSKIDIKNFDVVVSGDMGVEYKPSPEPYIKACESLHVDSDKAIAFEDSESGVKSANDAGVKCFLIPGRAPVGEHSKSSAFAVCENLAKTIPLIEEKFKINTSSVVK